MGQKRPGKWRQENSTRERMQKGKQGCSHGGKMFGDRSIKVRWSWKPECKSAKGRNGDLGKVMDRLSIFVMHSGKESLAALLLGN